MKFANQEEFLKFAQKYYKDRKEIIKWSNQRVSYCVHLGDHEKEAMTNWLYKLGRDYQVLDIDYEQFRNVVKEENKYKGKYFTIAGIKFRKSHLSTYYEYFLPQNYRVLRSFTYTGQSKKNKPSKNDWWERKQFARDRKTYWDNRTRDLKYYCSRRHRRLEKETIKTKRYDDFHRLTYKYAENRWNWD